MQSRFDQSVNCYSAHLGGIDYFFGVASATDETGVEQALTAVFEKMTAILKNDACRKQAVYQTLFISDERKVPQYREAVRDFYGQSIPATTYVAQCPCSGQAVTIEVFGLLSRDGSIELKRSSDHLTIAHFDGTNYIYGSDFSSKRSSNESVFSQASQVLSHLESALREETFRFNQIVRTWIYIGDIVGPEGDTQRYKELNRARSDFYENIEFLSGQTGRQCPSHRIFPASTGIGASNKSITLSCLAVDSVREDVYAVALENPFQTAAFDYATEYSPKSPKFSRAMALVNGDVVTIYVSGTASIVQAETKFVGNLVGQVNQTLDNIEALISPPNLANHGCSGFGASLRDLASARVYLKRADYFNQARKICEDRMGSIPIVYTVADVCRDELLVEIEAVVINERKS